MKKQMPEEVRQGLLRDTFEMAHAFVDDLGFIRERLASDQLGPADLRRMSAQLRRFLVDGDLQKIASPRLGRLIVQAPQLRDYHHANERSQMGLFSGGKLEFAFGMVANIAIGCAPLGDVTDVNETVDLTLEQFRDQRVICFQGEWITREQVIKFVANKGGGVHHDKPKERFEERLERLRGFAGIKINKGFPSILMNADAMKPHAERWAFDKDRMDFALIQLMSTAQYLDRSPQVQELEKLISAEG